MKITVNILKSLILKLESELLFFEENTKFLTKRKLEVAKEYYVGLKIKNFLDSLKEQEKNARWYKRGIPKILQRKNT